MTTPTSKPSPSPRHPPHRRMAPGTLAVLALLTALSACQSPPAAVCQEPVVPVYARADDSQAVAAGNFGAVPLALAGAAELQPSDGAAPPAGAQVLPVRTQGGQPGWVIASSLPPGWPRAAGCTD